MLKLKSVPGVMTTPLFEFLQIQSSWHPGVMTTTLWDGIFDVLIKISQLL